MSPLRSLILDMDGVLWRGEQALLDLPDVFSRIEKKRWQVLCMTNNATRSIEQYLEKLASFGVKLQSWQVLSSAQATARYLRQQFPQSGSVFIVGERVLKEVLAQEGFPHAEQDVLAVVTALDRQLTYEKLARATLLIRAGAPLIATNPDRTFPTPDGLVPGAGAIVAALEAATDTGAVITGKPNPDFYKAALERLGTSPEETLAIGDRLETDIYGAQALGMRTGLVLSGVTSLERAHLWQPAPDYIAQDLADLLGMIE